MARPGIPPVPAHHSFTLLCHHMQRTTHFALTHRCSCLRIAAGSPAHGRVGWVGQGGRIGPRGKGNPVYCTTLRLLFPAQCIVEVVIISTPPCVSGAPQVAQSMPGDQGGFRVSTHGPDEPAITSITTALLLLPSYGMRTSHPKLTSPAAAFSLSQVAIRTEDGQEGSGTSPQVP